MAGVEHPVNRLVGEIQHVRFTCTGGYWSDYCYEKLFKTSGKKVIPVLVGDVGSKDVDQFNIWCRVKNLEGEVYKSFNELPFCIALSWEDFYKFCGEKIGPNEEFVKDVFRWNKSFVKDFYKYLEEKMAHCSGFIEGFPYPIFNRDYIGGISLLVEEDCKERLVRGFEPGNGFKWLCTGRYIREAGSVYGEYTTRDYIEDMFLGRFYDSPYYPELRFNKSSKDFLIDYGVGLLSVGWVPSRIRDICKVNYPFEAQIPSIDLESLRFFEKFDWCNKVIGQYAWPRICLKNEMVSVSRFCDSTNLSCNFDNMDGKWFIEAFEYCVEDWGFKRQSISLSSEDFIVRNRSWTNSPGYPYNKNFCREARQAYDVYYGLLKHYWYCSMADWMPTIFNVFCKKEILKKEKVEKDDVRTIIAPALCQQLVLQRLTLKISIEVSKRWRISHTSIGRTRWRDDVDFTGCRIGRFPIICEYDISKWDRSIKAFLMKVFWMYCWYVIDTESIEDFWQLANCFESTIYSFMLHKNGEMIRKMYGVPSGFTLTSYANSWIHTFINVLSFIELCPIECDKLRYFKQHCDFVCYGDDGLMGMSKEVSLWYTIEARSKWLKNRFGIVMEPIRCKLVDHYYFKFDGIDVDGIMFLGDVMKHDETLQRIVPVFKISKLINQFILGSAFKNYIASEKILICFGHFVECFFHPNCDVIWQYLIYLLDKYKFTYLTTTSYKSDYVEWLGVTNNDLIKKIKQMVYDKEKFWNFVMKMFYSVDAGDGTTMDS